MAPELRPPLRVGLLVDSTIQPNWAASLVADIRATSVARLVVVLVQSREPGRRALVRPRLTTRHLLYEIYTRLDDQLFRLRPDPLALRDLGALLGNYPRHNLDPPTSESADALPGSFQGLLRQYALDVLLHLGSAPLRRGATSVARFGTWSYRHCAMSQERGAPSGFWEVASAEPVTTCFLEAERSDEVHLRILARCDVATDTRSVRRNRSFA